MSEPTIFEWVVAIIGLGSVALVFYGIYKFVEFMNFYQKIMSDWHKAKWKYMEDWENVRISRISK